MQAKRNDQNIRQLTTAPDVYEVRPRGHGDGFDLISGGFRYGPIWYAGPDAVRNAIAYAKYRSRSRSNGAIIRVFDHSGAVIQTFNSQGDLRQQRKRGSFLALSAERFAQEI